MKKPEGEKKIWGDEDGMSQSNLNILRVHERTPWKRGGGSLFSIILEMRQVCCRKVKKLRISVGLQWVKLLPTGSGPVSARAKPMCWRGAAGEMRGGSGSKGNSGARGHKWTARGPEGPCGHGSELKTVRTHVSSRSDCLCIKAQRG